MGRFEKIGECCFRFLQSVEHCLLIRSGGFFKIGLFFLQVAAQRSPFEDRSGEVSTESPCLAVGLEKVVDRRGIKAKKAGKRKRGQ